YMEPKQISSASLSEHIEDSKEQELTTNKESWDDIVSQENPWINSNTSTRNTELSKQNNKTTHVSEKDLENSGRTSHAVTSAESPEPPELASPSLQKELTETNPQEGHPKEVSDHNPNTKENLEEITQDQDSPVLMEMQTETTTANNNLPSVSPDNSSTRDLQERYKRGRKYFTRC
ncbi:3648_t:CDS:2, partial [Dentiscutata heterogama]